MFKTEDLSAKEKTQRETKWNKRFHIALVAVVIIANLYVVVDTIKLNQYVREVDSQLEKLNYEYAELNEKRSELNGVYEKELERLNQYINRLRDQSRISQFFRE